MKRYTLKQPKFLLAMLFCTIAFSLFSQTLHIGYDAAGNRINLYNETDRSATQAGGSGWNIKFPVVKKPVEDQLFSASPNPSSNFITLSQKNKSEEGVSYSVALFDSNGKLVQQFPEVKIPFTLNIETYDPGLYFLKVSNKNTMQTVKIIKK